MGDDPDPYPRYVPTWDLLVALRRCQHTLEVTMDQSLRGLGMSFAQYRALETLSSRNPMHISWLARLLRVNRTSARDTVRQLENHGLVTTQREGHVVVVTVTPVAARRLDLCRRATAAIGNSVELRLQPTQRDQLLNLLGETERSFRPPPPRVRPWWLD
jgi:DNA-binding MarR family transcriptional regulator